MENILNSLPIKIQSTENETSPTSTPPHSNIIITERLPNDALPKVINDDVTIMQLNNQDSTPVSQSGREVLVNKLVQRIQENEIPMPLLLKDEQTPFLNMVTNAAITYFPPSPNAEDKSADDVLVDMGMGMLQKLWSFVPQMTASTPNNDDEKSTFDFLSRMNKPVMDFFEHLDFSRLLSEGQQAVPMGFFEQINSDKVKTYNAQHQTNFNRIEQTFEHNARIRFRETAKNFMESPDRNSPNFIRSVFEQMMRLRNFKSFSGCVMEDILLGIPSQNSHVLQLLELFIIDFIQSDRKSIWFQDATNNFGYYRSEEEWDRFVGESTDIRKIVECHMLYFEGALDFFYGTEEYPFPFSQALLDFMPHLEWALSVPFEALDPQLHFDRNQKTIPTGVHQSPMYFVFQNAFLMWGIQEIKRTNPELIDETLHIEILHRAKIAAYILPKTLEKQEANVNRIEISHRLRGLIEQGVPAAEYAARNLIQSRDPKGPKQNLVLGIGLGGHFFSEQPNAKHNPNRLFFNVSESGRRLPRSGHESKSLLSTPFLFAMQYLMQETGKTDSHELKKDIIPITILGMPTEGDQKVHRYLFERILWHTFTNEGIQLGPGMLAGATHEIIQTVNGYASMSTPQLKKLPEAQRVQETGKRIALAKQIENKMVAQERPILTPVEFQLLSEALQNRSSICVESVISRHNKNNLVVPIGFDYNRSDIVKIADQDVRIGQRPLIPPCDRYCQLFSTSHLLWADLTRNPSLDVLEKTAQENGLKGLTRWFTS